VILGVDTRCVLVLDEALAPGKAANAAAVMAMTLGTKVPLMIGDDFPDGAGALHPGLYREGLPILKAPADTLRELRAKAVAAEVGVIGFPVNGHQTNDYEEFVAMLGESADVSYLGLALYGPAKTVRKLTGSLPLLR
jgi:hypothetical protein